MNSRTQEALIELCEAIQDFANQNPMAETGSLQRAASIARDALKFDETVTET